jgi:hypothetical protein
MLSLKWLDAIATTKSSISRRRESLGIERARNPLKEEED